MTKVRRAGGSDASALVELCAQLGYPTDDRTVRMRLAVIADDPRHAVFVAEVEDGRVAGWIHVMAEAGLLTSGTAEIGGLVVDEGERRKGIASALVTRAELWAQENGCRTLVVRSNIQRDEAHRFYPVLGFSAVKDSRVYSKQTRD